jgi:gas vesicle protein
MANYDNESGAGILLAFICGAITGAAVALLFAPASGEETRGFLGDRAREGRERAAESARQGREALNRQREQLATAFEKGREAFESARKKEQEG